MLYSGPRDRTQLEVLIDTFRAILGSLIGTFPQPVLLEQPRI